MKTDEMVTSPSFEVNLGGIDLTEKQALELDKALRQTTLQFLAKMDNQVLENSFELIPNPDDPEPGPWPWPWGPGPRFGDPNPQPSRSMLDRRWWMGLRLLKLEAGGRFNPGLLRTNMSIPTGFKVEKISAPR